jgi:hypothetical protein
MTITITRGAVRFFFGVLALMFLGAVALVLAPRAVAADVPQASAPKIQLNAAAVTPRKLEDSTEIAIVRDYATAWQALARSLAENRTDTLNVGFVGIAKDQLTARVRKQQESGLRTRLVDHGHKVEAVFYSPEGSAIQLRDTAQLEMQVLDGDKVIHSEHVTQHYVALMTVAELGWKVRVLETVPSF